MKTALIIGSSGLTGRLLLDLLLQNPLYTKVVALNRKKIAYEHPKLDQQIVDFDHLQQYSPLIQADEVFCCIGTTISKAGSVSNFRKVDYDIPVQTATMAKTNGVRCFAVISSMGVQAGRGNYYLKAKYDMETAIRALAFEQTIIVRPSLILGNRTEARMGESIGKALAAIVNPLLTGRLRKFRGIQATDIAKAMLYLANANFDEVVFESDALQSLAQQYTTPNN